MSFTSIGQGLLGGMMIGSSAAALLLGNGDILGASGIVSSVALNPKQTLSDPSQRWKIFFIASFLSVSAFVFGPRYNVAQAVAESRPISMLGYAVSGFLVGLGTRLSNGCTSGHGVCGLARRSQRSLAAVCTFMATGIATSILTSPTLTSMATLTAFLRTDTSNTIKMTSTGHSLAAIAVLAALFAPLFYTKTSKQMEVDHKDDTKKIPIAIASGALFASGLYVSLMAFPGKVLGFLEMTNLANGTWDATLVGVLGGAVTISFLSYQFVDQHSCSGTLLKPIQHPLALSDQSQFCVPTNKVIDRNLIVGAALFGTGWGVSGLCPGPAMLAAGVGFPAVLMSYWPAFLIGSYLGSELKK
jgi:uncharacterized protein